MDITRAGRYTSFAINIEDPPPNNGATAGWIGLDDDNGQAMQWSASRTKSSELNAKLFFTLNFRVKTSAHQSVRPSVALVVRTERQQINSSHLFYV